MKKVKHKKTKQPVWSNDTGTFYKCKKCHKWFLLENFNLNAGMCKECAKTEEATL